MVAGRVSFPTVFESHVMNLENSIREEEASCKLKWQISCQF
jgi:hypothetical protein